MATGHHRQAHQAEPVCAGRATHPRHIAEIAAALCHAAFYQPSEEELLMEALIFQIAKERRWRAEVSF